MDKSKINVTETPVWYFIADFVQNTYNTL